jgi:ubiquinone/menaquinone biosynthesis C-methylase UbiE
MRQGYAEERMTIGPCSTTRTDARVQATLGGAPTSPALPFTGERIVPGQVSEPLFREHEARYVFASRFVKDKTVLDVACGTGIGTHYLLTEGARSCLGLDIDGPALEYARAVYEGCQFEECDAANLCVPDGSMDVVVSFETIEHLKDQLKFLSECNRVLRPGGVLVCSTPNLTMSRWAPENPYHLHEFTVAEFRRALETIFIDVLLFGQQNTNQLVYAAQRLLSRALHALQLVKTAKGILGWKSLPPATRTEFGGVPIDSGNEIQPYRPSPVMQPRYVIAVARRSH